MSDRDDSLVGKARARLSALVSSVSPVDSDDMYQFPAFDELPPVLGQLQGCLWGFFDRDGKKDEIGTLNLLTPFTVRSAASEIRTGERIQLDRQLSHGQELGFPGRKSFEHKIIDYAESSKMAVFDDEISMNTQASSQWDGLKHFAHQKSRMYYNGLPHDEAGKVETNGIHNWSDRGGIVGRGVLVDWARWHEQKYGTLPNPATRYEIPISQIQETLDFQGTNTKQGDILIVRSGFGRHLDSNKPEGPPKTIGVQADEASVRWIYSKHFSAVAGDALAFEAWPPRLKTGWTLHEWLLVQFGTPIGELWDLEKLGRMCEKQGRWSFFLTSAPLNVKGGVGSPPGVIAIF